MGLNIIKKYLSEFHDGALLAIEHVGQDYILSLESAQMDRLDMKDDLSLSERGTIKGKLHLVSGQSIKMNESMVENELKMKYNYGSIFYFAIKDNLIEIQISWRNAPKKSYINEFSTIVIKAENVWWENIPDLYDPFW